jgi:hypothetical protein
LQYPNFAYAKQAFAQVVADRPDIIEKVNRSGLGDDPAIIELLARDGRLSAHLMGDHTIARRNNDVTSSPMASANPRGSTVQEQLNDLLNKTPLGSAAYRTPAVQRRVEALSRQLAGNKNIVGQGGRFA